MTLPVFDHLAEIASTVSAAHQLFLFLDFDGTLAPIVDDPDKAYMPEETRKALRELAGKDRVFLAIISGRELSDLRERVGFKQFIYAGNHGLEISGPGMNFVEPGAALQIKALGELARHLRLRLHDIPGVEVENKVLSASVHFRRAQPERREEIDRVVRNAVESIGNLFEVTMGRKVFEIRPRVSWHKGRAVRWIKEMCGGPDALSIYLGDDATDEDAFSVLSGDITISVGRCARTSARYCLERQEAAQEFLAWLAELTVAQGSECEMLTQRPA
ncbi:MAG TPA: trehalose-phosphatase [Bryobacteraceae bacterium]|nr:trehalose-phosphatase [Bryobacteraceae bacterium]